MNIQTRIHRRIDPCLVKPDRPIIGNMPPRRRQLVTPATHWGSQELAKDVAEDDNTYQMEEEKDIEETPTQQSNEMLQLMHQMQQQLQEQESHYKDILNAQGAQIDNLQQRLGSEKPPQQQQGNSDPAFNKLVEYLQQNTLNVLDRRPYGVDSVKE